MELGVNYKNQDDKIYSNSVEKTDKGKLLF